MAFRLTRPVWLAILAVFLVQGALVAWTFPLSEVLTDRDILYIDHPFHLYQIYLAKVFADQGGVIGYDPFFEAGNVGGVTQNLSAMVPALWAWLASSILSIGQSYKLYIVFASCLGPLCVVLASVAVERPIHEVWMAGLAGLFIWWVSAFHWYHTAGMVASTLAGFAALLFCVLLLRYITDSRSNWLGSVGFGLAAACGFFLHPQFSFPVAIFAFVLAWLYRDETPFTKLVGYYCLIGVVALLPNLPWLLIKLSAMTAYVSPISYQAVVNPIVPFYELLGLWKTPSMGAKVYPLLFIASLWAVFGTRDPAWSRLYRGLACAWLGLVSFAAIGAALPGIAMIQPNRFAPVGYVFLIIPAVAGIILCTQTVIRAPIVIRGVACVSMLAMLGLSLLSAKELAKEISATPDGHYGSVPPEVLGEGPITRAMLDWINVRTAQDGRILFETSLGRVHDKGHIVGYLAMKTEREFVGGPYTSNQFAGFHDGWLFGGAIERINASRLADYLRLYNIGWVMAHSEISKRYFDAIPYLRRDVLVGPVQTYVFEESRSYFIEGSGKVLDRKPNRIVIEANELGKQLILKYHYVNGIKASDGSMIRPVYFYDDPQPFIALTPQTPIIELSM